MRKHFLKPAAWILLLCIPLAVRANDPRPILLGLDAEFGLENSISAQAIEMGIRIALAEINAAGGVLDGRPLELVTRDNRSIPARGLRNLAEFIAMPRLLAVFGGRYSPVIIEQLPRIKDAGLPFLAVWSSADTIIPDASEAHSIFRLSLRDSLALPKMLDYARRRGLSRIGLLINNSAWGRSSLAAAEKAAAADHRVKLVRTAWYNIGEHALLDKYFQLLKSGAQAIVVVANDDEAASLVRDVATLPTELRIPLISHWGISGGRFVEEVGPALQKVDLTVVQSFSFFRADPRVLAGFMRTLHSLYGFTHIEQIQGPAGVAQAYDMTHILARAINRAGKAERGALSAALEQLGEHRGLVRHYRPPFTHARHEALGPEQLLMARYRQDGVLVPLQD